MTLIGGAIIFISKATMFVGGVITFIGKATMFIGGVITFIGKAIIFVDKGSSAVGGRLFRAVRAKLYYCWVGCRGLYKLSCYRSLALVKGKGEASKAYAGGACVNRAYTGGAYADKAAY